MKREMLSLTFFRVCSSDACGAAETPLKKITAKNGRSILSTEGFFLSAREKKKQKLICLLAVVAVYLYVRSTFSPLPTFPFCELAFLRLRPIHRSCTDASYTIFSSVPPHTLFSLSMPTPSAISGATLTSGKKEGEDAKKWES